MAQVVRVVEEQLAGEGLPATVATDFAELVERVVTVAGRGRAGAARLRVLLDAVVETVEMSSARADLPADERAIWESVGARFDESAVDRARDRRLTALADLVSRSVAGDVTMAERLGVDRSRISQRLSEGSLYAFTLGSERWFPEWQLVDGSSVPGLKAVLAAVPAALHPLTVDHWFTTASVDLEIDTEAVSPVEWLATGGDPGPVVALVADL